MQNIKNLKHNMRELYLEEFKQIEEAQSQRSNMVAQIVVSYLNETGNGDVLSPHLAFVGALHVLAENSKCPSYFHYTIVGYHPDVL